MAGREVTAGGDDGGRGAIPRSKISSKAKRALLHAAEEIFVASVEELRTTSRALESAMESQEKGEVLRKILSEWIHRRNELDEARDEWSGIMEEEQYRSTKPMFLQIFSEFEEVRERAVQYIDAVTGGSQADRLPLTELERMQQTIDQLQRELEDTKRQNESLRSLTNAYGGPRATSSTIDTRQPRAAEFQTVSEIPAESTMVLDERPPPTTEGTAQDTSSEEVKTLYKVLEMIGSKTSEDHLPRVEPEKFEGDIMTFPVWWNSFEVLVEEAVTSDARRLHLLGQYTTGKAKDAIKCHLQNVKRPQEAYQAAKLELHRIYGDNVKLSAAYREKIKSWPSIKKGDSQGLSAYANFLWQCNTVRESVGYLGSLDNPEENLRFVSKLPADVRRAWNRKVVTQLYPDSDQSSMTLEEAQEHRDYPAFAEFCAFVTREARVAGGPCAVKEEKEESKDSQRRGRARSYQTGARERNNKCLFCKEEHRLKQCKKFLSQDYEVKKAFAVENHLCYGCLGAGHGIRICRYRDDNLLRRPGYQPKATTMKTDIRVKNRVDSKPAVTLKTGKRSNRVQFSSMIVQTWVYSKANPDDKQKIYVVLDTQSDSCFLTEELAESLNAHAEPVVLELTTMNSTKEVDSNEVTGVCLQGLNSKKVVSLPACYTRDDIPVDRNTIPRPAMAQEWKHLEKLASEIPEYDPEVPVGALVGYNCASALLPRKVKSGADNDPYAVQTELGWTIVGPVSKEQQSKTKVKERLSSFNTSSKKPKITTEELCKAFDFEFEQPGDASFKKRSQEDEQFIRTMEEGIKFDRNGRVELPLPFRKRQRKLPDSRRSAYRRLMQQKKKFERNRTYWKKYNEFINTMLQNGYAEKVNLDELGEDEELFFLSHQGVFHPRKKDEVRVVFDGSQETDGVSLNSMLITGPDMGNRLLGVLMRFRMGKEAFQCDVEKMFLQVKVPESQRNMLCFLWFPDGDLTREPEVYRLTVHLFGASSSPACAAYAFKAVAEKFGGDHSEEAVDFLRRNFYVDDGLGSNDDQGMAEKIMRESHEICEKGCFNLKKYISSNADINEKISEELRAKDIAGKEEIVMEDIKPQMSLGMHWRLKDDALAYPLELPEKESTRRGMLATLGSAYDPLGLISPAVLPGRIMLQELCKRKLSWDQKVSEEVERKWKAWVEQLRTLRELAVPRWYRLNVVTSDFLVELRIFCDASMSGYGVCAYLVFTDREGNEDRSLVATKSRVAPVKAVTVPRLELQACLLGVQMGETIQEEIPYDYHRVSYYTDSTPALGYICNETLRCSIFVTNRSTKIRSKTTADQWGHVETDMNPADLASRGVSAEELMNSELYWKGPPTEYLRMRNLECDFSVPEDDPELKKSAKVFKTGVKENQLLDSFSAFSKLDKMSGVMAWILRYVGNLRCKAKKTPCPDKPMHLTSEERQAGTLKLVTLCQAEFFPGITNGMARVGVPDSRQNLRARRAAVKRDRDGLYRLDPFLDHQGVVRVGGRLQQSEMPMEYVHPVLLPGRHFLTTAVIDDCHWRVKHSGRNITLNMVRTRGWWVLHGKGAVDRYLRKCVTCRRLRGPMAQQKMADLPLERIEPAAPFTYCGADFMGPFHIRERRSMLKRYICLYTCMVTRAVHLEVCKDLTASSFINSFRRFTNRRGPVKVLRTDRGTNFVGGNNDMKQALAEMDVDEVRAGLLREECDYVEHRFNTPNAPHHGGAWERLVGVVKRTLEPALAKYGDRLDEDNFKTVTTEAEMIMNSRPITAAEMSDPNSPAPLSPAQILTNKSTINKAPPGKFEPEDECARKLWRRAQLVSEDFWNRWRREYIPLLQARAKWQEIRPNLRIGDVLVCQEEGLPRMKWPLAVVIATTAGEDGLIRSVRIRTVTGSYDRPVTRVALLYRPPEVEGSSQSRSLDTL